MTDVVGLLTWAMQVDTFGEGDDLIWVMGWGNSADSRHERWLIDQFVDAGYRVHAVELPTNGTHFERDYLRPVRVYRADLDDHAVVSHSMGGLVTAHLQPASPAVYLSPFWGFADFPTILRPLLYLPVSKPIFPAGVSPEGIGELATEADATAPKYVSPRWLLAITRAQQALPPLDEDDVVFYTPDDQIVDPKAIESHASEDQLRTYDGGHELFSSADRDRIVERVLDALADGA